MTRRGFWLWFTLGLLQHVAPVHAQSTFGSIVGSVKDASGVAAPATLITIRELDENTTRTATSDHQGLYEVVHLKPGRYEITALKAGFSKYAIPEVPLEARQTIRADIRLVLSPVKETLVVTGTAPVINTENGTIADSKTFREISRLPLNFRGWSSSPWIATMIVPGVQHDATGHPSIGGGMPTQVEYSVDGVSTVNAASYGVISNMFPSPEMLSEFKVTSVNNSAEFGQMGDVTLTTKSGGNKLHGSAFWYHQNSALDATTYGSVVKAARVFNTFGGSLSGPVYVPGIYHGHDKTFFFVDYEAARRPYSPLDQFSVPTAAMRSGNLNGVPGSPAVDPLSGVSFPGNTIPASRINPVARTLLANYYPLPNFDFDGTTHTNFRRLLPLFYNAAGYDVRVDHVISPRQQIFARWSWKHLPALYPNSLLPLSHYDESDRNLVLSHNYTLKPNLVNESRFGLSLHRFAETFPIVGREAVATLGLQGLDLRNVGDGGGFPGFDFSGGTGFTAIGHGREVNAESRNFQLADNLSWIKGSHTARFGLDMRRLGNAGTLIMSSSDFGVLSFAQKAFSGNAFADLLLGLPQFSSYSVSGPNLSESAVHSHFYAQDTWRVNNRLTLTFGLRWQLHPPMTEASGNGTNFDRTTGNVIIPDRTIAPAPGFLAGINACPGTTTAIPCTKILTASQVGLGPGLRGTDYSNWTPRVSFAYRPFSNNRTVVRAGLGIFTQTVLGSTALLLTGVHTSDSRSYANYQGPGVAPLFVLPQVHTGDVGALPPPGAENFSYATDLNYKDPRSYQWNFTIERQLPGDTSLRLSYVGSHSIGMNLPVDLNQQHASTTPFSASRRPYLAWNHPVTFDNLGFASYHAMQTEITHRFGKGLFFQSSYVFSKNVGNAGGKFGGANSGAVFPYEAFSQIATDRFNTRLDRGELTGTRRHRFLFTGIYELPFGRGRRLASGMNALANAVFGGWDLSTITLVQSGSFMTPRMNGFFDQSNTDMSNRSGATRPDRIGDGNLADPTPNRWFDISAFTLTAAGCGCFGNAGVGILRGPGTIAVAGGLFKTFPIAEKLRMRFEATFTNLPNHPNFAPPSADITTPVSFGKITSVQYQENSGNRVGQLALRMDF